MMNLIKKNRQIFKKIIFKYRSELILTFIWGLASFLANPAGNFPLNDDWAYTMNVYYLSELGILKFSDWPAMTLIAQMLYGTIFCKLFGFSFIVLRYSVILLGITGIILVYRIMKETTSNQALAFYAAILVCFNPLYFLLSHSFMTEVPFFVAILASLYSYVLFNRNKNKLLYFVLAVFFSMIATLIRQTGIVLSIAFLMGYFLTYRRLNSEFFKYVIACLTTVFTLIVFVQWLKYSGNISSHFSAGSELFKQGNMDVLYEKLWKRSYILLFYYGLFLLPLLLLVFISWFNSFSLKTSVLILLTALFAGVPVFFIWDEVPVWNILNFNGLGPRLLKDLHWGVNVRPGLPYIGTILIKLLASAGSIMLLFACLSFLIRQFNIIKNREKLVFACPMDNQLFLLITCLLVIVAYWIFLLLGVFFFDRYFILLLPFFIILLTSIKPAFRKLTNYMAFVIILIYAGFSIMATCDYFSWNRARWKALDKLIAEGISPKQIDGGFEFNGWYQTSAQNDDVQPGKSWWFVDDDKYIIAAGDFCGYRKEVKFSYRNFLNFRDDSLFILKRIDNYRVDTIKVQCDAESDTCLNGITFLRTTNDSLYCNNPGSLTGISAYSGQRAVLTNRQHPYAFTILLNEVAPCESIRISIQTKFNRKNAVLVAASEKINDFYRSETVKDTLNPKSWHKIELVLNQYAQLPSALKIYAWNPSEEAVLFDDLVIERFIPIFSEKD